MYIKIRIMASFIRHLRVSFPILSTRTHLSDRKIFHPFPILIFSSSSFCSASAFLVLGWWVAGWHQSVCSHQCDICTMYYVSYWVDEEYILSDCTYTYRNSGSREKRSKYYKFYVDNPRKYHLIINRRNYYDKINIFLALRFTCKNLSPPTAENKLMAKPLRNTISYPIPIYFFIPFAPLLFSSSCT